MASDKKGAAKRPAKIAFLDESGFSLKGSIRRTWAPRGQTPIVRQHFSWDRLNAIGSLVFEPDGTHLDLLLHLQAESIKHPAVIGFLEELHRHVPGCIVVLLDHLQAHRDEETLAYMAANRDWLIVEWLPSYSSGLNPLDYFWSVAKGEPTANAEPDTLEEIARCVRTVRERVADDQAVLHGFLEAAGLYGEMNDCPLT